MKIPHSAPCVETLCPPQPPQPSLQGRDSNLLQDARAEKCGQLNERTAARLLRQSPQQMACAVQEMEEGTETEHGTGAKSSHKSKEKGENSMNSWEFRPLLSFTLQSPTHSSGHHQITAFLQSLLFFPPKFALYEACGCSPAKARPPSGWAPLPLTALVEERSNHLSQKKTKQTPTNKQTKKETSKTTKNPPSK